VSEEAGCEIITRLVATFSPTSENTPSTRLGE
jgi:hypothetical protein